MLSISVMLAMFSGDRYFYFGIYLFEIRPFRGCESGIKQKFESRLQEYIATCPLNIRKKIIKSKSSRKSHTTKFKTTTIIN